MGMHRTPEPPAPASTGIDFHLVMQMSRNALIRLELAIDRARVGLDVTPSCREIATTLREAADRLDPPTRSTR